jgi:hypothetical protein
MPTKKKQPKRADWLTDEQVEEEITKLKSDEYVKLAKEEERIRYRRRAYLYQLRQYQKKGKELAEAGITIEILRAMDEGGEPSA